MKKHTSLRASALELSRPALILSKFAAVRRRQAELVAERDALLETLLAEYGASRLVSELVALADVEEADRAMLRRHHVRHAQDFGTGAIRALCLFVGNGTFAGKSKVARTARWEHVEWVWHFEQLRDNENALRDALYSGPERRREVLYGGRGRRREHALVVRKAPAPSRRAA